MAALAVSTAGLTLNVKEDANAPTRNVLDILEVVPQGEISPEDAKKKKGPLVIENEVHGKGFDTETL
jgi:hypothetical protein